MVVAGIATLLAALLFPAIQTARETTRRSQCTNNLRQIGVALTNFHAAQRTFPAGSELSVVNRIRYYVLPDNVGTVRLMRMVDGGANTLIGGLRDVQFHYFARGGEPAIDPGSVARIRIEAETAFSRLPVSKDIAIRSQL